jgi:hypothetical protein
MKTNEAMGRRVSRYRRALWLVLFAAACGGSVTKAPSVGSESHFLEHCEGSCEGGFDCIGGICTRPCLTEQSSCAALAVNAACTNQSVEPGQVAVCDVSCGAGTGCGALGVDYACESGYCRKASSSSSSSSGGAGGGSGAMVGSSGTGPTAGSSGTSSGGASGGVPGVDCRPVGRYEVGKEGGYLPCCPGLTQLSTWVEAYVNDADVKTCVDAPVNSYSCIAGSCGDGICEDAEAPCGCGVDCPDSNWRASDAICEPFRDQSPPPDIRTISITNTGSVPLYIERLAADCGLPSSLVQVERDGAPVNVSGIPECGPSCQNVMDEGWRQTPSCQNLCKPIAPVVIEPGQTLQQPTTLEVVTQRLPRACAAGIVTDTIECSSRVIPQPGNYVLRVRAALQLECFDPLDCACRPDATGACTGGDLGRTPALLVFNFPSTWYFQNQELQIAAPGN